jgi:hypothetical protein
VFLAVDASRPESLLMEDNGVSTSKDSHSTKRRRNNDMSPQDCNGSEKPSKRPRSGPETNARNKVSTVV